MAKLLKLRRGSTSQHSSFTGAEGEVTVDTDKETLVVHDGSTAGGFPMLRASGGSEAISTTGSLSSGNITVSSNAPKIDFVDGNNNPDFRIDCNSGAMTIIDTTNSANRLIIQSDGTLDVQGNLDANAGLDVTGNITTTGDISINSNAPNILFTDGNDNPDFGILASGGQFKIQDTTNTANLLTCDDSKIQAVKNLDALAGVDVTGNITVTGTVDGRDVASDGSKLDGIESGATADQSASEILTAIKTVDGSGSGLDADSVDGLEAGNLLRSDTADTAQGDITFDGGAGAATIGANSDVRFTNGNWTGEVAGKIQQHSNYLYFQGGSSGFQFRSDGGTDRLTIDSNGHVLPSSNNSYNLGSSSKRWANIYTQDLQLSNEATGDNGIDGTWGNYTIVEGESDLFLKNNRSGKTYKFNLTEVS